LETGCIFVRALPFGTTIAAFGFVFVAPNLNIAAAYVTFDIGWFGLQEIP
jgi:hypothetical protein